MSITPADIEALQFPIAFRGYQVEAVDNFLDRLQADLAEVSADRAGEAAPVGGAADQAPTPDTSSTAADHRTEAEDAPAARALRTLARAEQMAEQMTAEAVAEADAIRARAHIEARDIVVAARAESSRIEAEVELRRQREIGGLMLQAQQLRSEIDRLTGVERQFREALQALVSEQQRLLEQRVPHLGAAPATGATLTAETLDSAA